MAAATTETRGGFLPEALGRAVATLAVAEPATWALSDSAVADALGHLGELRHLLDVAEVALTREGVSRGLPQEAGWTPHDWVSLSEGASAPQPSPRHVAQVLRVSKIGERASALFTAPEVETGLDEVVEAFTSGELPLGKTDQLARFHKDVSPLADPELLAADIGILLEAARDVPRGACGERVAGLTERQLGAAIAQTTRLLKPAAELEREHERFRAARSFQRGPGPLGMTSYRVLLDPEASAILDAAIDALSRPTPDEEGAADERSPAQRRADALIAIVQRGVSSPGDAPKTEKAQILVTIPYAALVESVDGAASGPGSALTAGAAATHLAGVTATGGVLPPDVVRRMACDATIIPAVLGSDGEILDLGQAVRLYTPGLRRAIWHRDQGCTYPGCTMPPQWCDAHHVLWWSRGGATSLENSALLCQRHHTKVHQRDLTATVTATGVTWHL